MTSKIIACQLVNKTISGSLLVWLNLLKRSRAKPWGVNKDIVFINPPISVKFQKHPPRNAEIIEIRGAPACNCMRVFKRDDINMLIAITENR